MKYDFELLMFDEIYTTAGETEEVWQKSTLISCCYDLKLFSMFVCWSGRRRGGPVRFFFFSPPYLR